MISDLSQIADGFAIVTALIFLWEFSVRFWARFKKKSYKWQYLSESSKNWQYVAKTALSSF
jgi:hypothetical protein